MPQGLPGNSDLAENGDKTVDPQGVRRCQSGRAYRFWMVSPTGHVPGALLVRAYLLARAYGTLNFQAQGEWRITSGA